MMLKGYLDNLHLDGQVQRCSSLPKASKQLHVALYKSKEHQEDLYIQDNHRTFC